MSKLGVHLGDQTYVWAAVMDEARLMQRAAHVKATRVLWILSIVKTAVLAVLAVLFLMFSGAPNLLTVSFWLNPSWTSVFVYGTMLAILFL
jgi:hypothetical protein